MPIGMDIGKLEVVRQAIMTIEARLAMLEHRQEIWQTIIRYARGIDEQRPEELEAIFTEDVVSQTRPWSRRLEGKALVLKAFRNYQRNLSINPLPPSESDQHVPEKSGIT